MISRVANIQALVVLLLSMADPSHQTKDVQSDTKLIGGTDAAADRYPYFTLFQGRPCSGALVAPDVVLTAAHCAGQLTTAEVGIYDFNGGDTRESFDVVSEVTHPFWNGRIPNFDMMLVKLSGMSTKTPLTMNTNTSFPLPNSALTTLGFNYTLAGELDADTPILQAGAVDFITNVDCELMSDPIQDISLNNAVTTQWLCTNATNNGICFGDGGTAVILEGATPADDRHMGVAAGNFGCKNPYLPDVYQRTAPQYAWLLLAVCDLSAEPPLTFDCPSDPPSMEPSVIPSDSPSSIPSDQPSALPTATPL